MLFARSLGVSDVTMVLAVIVLILIRRKFKYNVDSLH
jgi:hypothetical protein